MDLSNKYTKVIGVSEAGINNLQYIVNYKNNKQILATEEISENQDIDKDYAAKILDEVDIMFITYNSKEQRTCDIVKAINYMANERRVISIGLDLNTDAKKVEFELNAEIVMTEENKEAICELISMMVISVEEETTINIDLTDIKEVLSTEQGLVYSVIESDKSLDKEGLVEKLFENILKTNEELNNKKAVVFVSIGEKYCKVEDVLLMLTAMLEDIQGKISPKCDLIFSLDLDNNLNDKIKIGLVHN
ncbi:MAG: hypothetical protein ACRCXT_20100 [Paraclostridium sp.]